LTLLPGTKLGPYEIQSLIGAGGMGQVYKARDTRLNRMVAVKLLAPDVADRPDRRRRFEAEARAISSLSHPHICSLFDVGETDGHPFIVMEYLQGETLDDRLSRGALTSIELLRYGAQIADALDHAHRGQIVHRDLKPSNVMLTESGVKLLDFGLAKGLATAPPPGLNTTASFDQRKLTAEGSLIGTFHYMAPEQVEGKTVDRRSDIFAFGVVLYEMATGRKAFDGESQASLIAAILTDRPSPISSVRPVNERDPLPPALDHVVERCLAKHPDERWQTARDLKAELNWIATSGSQTGARQLESRRGSRSLLVAITAAVGIAVAAAWVLLPRRPATADVTRFLITLPPGTTLMGGRDTSRLAVSPDGRRLAFVASSGGREQLWVQSFGSTTPQPLEGTDGAMSPFWSPDSRLIGFFTPREGQLKKIEASGGPPRVICAAVMGGLPVWMRDNTILFTEFRKGIYRVSADGGQPAPVTVIDTAQRELNHFWPSPLPDGRHFLYMVTRLESNGRRGTPIVYVGSLDSSERREVTRTNSRMVYSPTGHVLYVHEGTLLAQAFDVNRFQLTGEPVRLADGLDYFRSTGAAGFSVSEGGVLAHHGGSGALELMRFDRTGRRIGAVGTPQRFGNLRLSPDGQQVAVEVLDPRLGTSDIWIHHLARAAPTRFTSDLNDEMFPVWSPNGDRIIFGSDRGTGLDASADFFEKQSDGTGDEKLFFDQLGFQAIEDWSRDTRWIVYTYDNRETGGNDLWILPTAADRKPEPFQQNRFDEWGARFSPNGEWVAFVTDESGTFEIYVAPFRRRGSRSPVSTGGGIAPRWRRDGKELFYITSDGKSVMAVPVELTPSFKAGTPVRLFSIGSETGFRGRARNVPYDVSPDGQRFLINVATAEPASSRITVALNWTEALKR
jgi:Tol biopolymer transport system component